MKKVSVFVLILISLLAVSCATAVEEAAVPAAAEIQETVAVAAEPAAPAEPEPVAPAAPAAPVLNQTTGKEYATIGEAFAEIADGDVIILNGDVSSDIPVSTNKSFTLDLNGFTFTGAYIISTTNTGCLNVEGTAAEPVKQIVVKNGTIKGAYAGTKRSGGIIRASHVDDVLLENLTLIDQANDDSLTYSMSLYLLYTPNAVARNCDFTGAVLCYWNASKGPQTVFHLQDSTLREDSTSADVMVLNSQSDCIITFDNVTVESGTMLDDFSTGQISFGAGSYSFNPSKFVDPAVYSIDQEGEIFIVKAK